MIELTIPGMHCGGCAKTITRLVTETDPAARIEISLENKHVSIQTTLARETVVAKLTEAGFEPA